MGRSSAIRARAAIARGQVLPYRFGTRLPPGGPWLGASHRQMLVASLRPKTEGDSMSRKLVNRRAVAILTAALTLGVAGPAAARPLDTVGPSSHPPAGDQTVTTTQSGGSSDVEYLLIGGVAVVISGA